MTRLACLALFGGLLAALPGAADDKKTAAPPAMTRAVYAVKDADPEALAEAVGRHFSGEAVVVAAPAGAGGAVLVSGTAAAVPEVVKLLERLDRKPQAVEVEVVIVEGPATKDGKELTAADFLAADGSVKEGKGMRIKLTAVEGQPVTSTVGGNKPLTSGAVAGGRGAAAGNLGFGAVTRNVTYHAVGTTVKLTARVGAGDAVSVDLNVQDSRVRATEEEPAAPTFDTGTLTTKVSVPPGKAVVAQAVRADGKAGPTLAVVFVTARVVADKPAALPK